MLFLIFQCHLLFIYCTINIKSIRDNGINLSMRGQFFYIHIRCLRLFNDLGNIKIWWYFNSFGGEHGLQLTIMCNFTLRKLNVGSFQLTIDV